MNSITCFIIDDQPSIDLLTGYIDKSTRLKLKGTALSLPDASRQFLSIGYPAVLFINIDMKGDFDETLSMLISRSKTLVIATSRHSDKAMQAFETGIFDYLHKPLIADRFFKVVSRIYLFKPSYERGCFYIQCDKGKHVKVVFDEIRCINAQQNYVEIVLTNGSQLARLTMKEIAQKLPEGQFIRVHKSHIVNENRIQSITNENIIIDDNSVIKIGPDYREALLNKLLQVFCFILCNVELSILNNVPSLAGF